MLFWTVVPKTTIGSVDKSTLPSHPGNNYLYQFLLMLIRVV